jgi:flagellar biosynthesis protein FlhF
MRLKTFTAITLAEAMGQVRDRLGDEAVILATQEVDGGFKVTAALDDDLFPSAEGECGLIGAEWISALAELLEAHRVPVGLSDRLLGAAGLAAAEQPGAMLANALETVFDFAPLPFRKTASKTAGKTAGAPLLLMGPPGAGKSATAAKLCAHARLAGRAAQLVSMDAVSAGAREQASSFAEAIGVPLSMAETPERLQAIVRKCPADRLIVIDTMGVNPYDRAELADLTAAVRVVDAVGVLVQPAGGDALEAAEAAMAFAEAGARLFVPTRLDAARRFGSLLAAAQAANLSLMAGGVSPSLGSGLSPLTPRGLSRLLAPQWADDWAADRTFAPLSATGTHA